MCESIQHLVNIRDGKTHHHEESSTWHSETIHLRKTPPSPLPPPPFPWLRTSPLIDSIAFLCRYFLRIWCYRLCAFDNLIPLAFILFFFSRLRPVWEYIKFMRKVQLQISYTRSVLQIPNKGSIRINYLLCFEIVKNNSAVGNLSLNIMKILLWWPPLRWLHSNLALRTNPWRVFLEQLQHWLL